MRTENDTWDIRTSVGQTALFVATARALEAQKPSPAAVDPLAEVFCRAIGGDWADVLDGAAPDHQLKTDFGEHFVNFQALRTKYFDTYFQAAAADGVRQIVLLAAGLDSRGYRLDWPGGTVVYELDQPQVLEFKRDALARHGDVPTADRREIAVDLRDDWPRALIDNGFDTSRPSAWIVEGLLIYLPAVSQQQVFLGIDALSAPGSHAGIEESIPMEPDVYQNKKGEKRVFGNDQFYDLVYNEQVQPAAEWFGARGWRGGTTRLADYLHSHGRPLPVAGSEADNMISRISLVSLVKG